MVKWGAKNPIFNEVTKSLLKGREQYMFREANFKSLFSNGFHCY